MACLESSAVAEAHEGKIVRLVGFGFFLSANYNRAYLCKREHVGMQLVTAP